MSIQLQFFIFVWIVIIYIAKYLGINKIWLRKHESEVADSVSILAIILELVFVTPFFLVSLYKFNLSTLSVETLTVVTHLTVFAIGLGLWVNNGLSFKDKIARAFNIERKEYKSLLKEVLHPSGINKIFKFLCLFAVIDKELHEEEEKLLKAFAKEYGLNYNLTMSDVKTLYEANRHDSTITIMKRLQKQIKGYLDTSPPKKVVIYLEDLIFSIIKADKKITVDEEIISQEIIATLQHYLVDDADKKEKYHILLLPQNEQQEQAVLSINATLKSHKTKIHGTENAYEVESFYSESFANMVRSRYVELFKCFVTIEKY